MRNDLISRRGLINDLNKAAMEHHESHVPMVEHDFRELIDKAEGKEDKENGAMRVNICGIMHNVVEKDDNFTGDVVNFGEIDYKKCEIVIAKDMSLESKKETLCHEMIHGILIHLGYGEKAQDEQFVQAMANAIYQGFRIKEE